MLAKQLEEARAEVARLERLAAQANCAELGRHQLVTTGWANCGCHPDSDCSVPVYHCALCGGCDYGDNDEATKIRKNCEDLDGS